MKPIEDIATKLQTIEQTIKGVHSKEILLSIACEHTGRDPKFFKYFDIKLGGHSYRGWSYLPYGAGRDFLFGSLFYFLDNTPRVLRAYPRIPYADDLDMFGESVVCEEKIDGTNLGTWYESSINQCITKTRGTPDATGTSFNGVEFLNLAMETSTMYKIQQLTKNDYTIFTELYGYKNPCEYIKYTVPIAQKGLDIIDRRTHKFLGYKDKEKLFNSYDIPMPLLEWSGNLTEDKLTWMTHRCAEKYGIMDGMEGMVAKSWVPIINDQAFGKIKCEDCRNLAYIMAGGQIKVPEIKKAVRKALENIRMSESFNELMELARQELLEDYPETLVNTAGPKIREQLEFAFPQTTFDIWNALDGMALESYLDKAKIMPFLSSKFSSLAPGRVYQAYALYLKRRGEM